MNKIIKAQYKTVVFLYHVTYRHYEGNCAYQLGPKSLSLSPLTATPQFVPWMVYNVPLQTNHTAEAINSSYPNFYYHRPGPAIHTDLDGCPVMCWGKLSFHYV